MRCEEVRERWPEHLAGELAPDPDCALRAHVAACASCQAEFGGLDALWEQLDGLPAVPVPAERMRERFAAMVADEQVRTAATAARREQAGSRVLSWRPGFWPDAPVVQMAVAASLLLIGVLVGRSLPPTANRSAAAPAAAAPTEDIADVRSELREMRQMLTLSLLQQQSAAERLRGVSASEQLEQPGNEVVAALLDTLLHDPNDNVRLAAVDALRRFSGRDDVRRGTRRAAADTSSPLLQIAVIDFMVETRAPEAESVLRQLSRDQTVDEAVRGRAAMGLERLAS
jgi:HEAT repeat protein